MKVPIEATLTPALWQEGGETATLRAEALKGFTTSLGTFVPPSSGNKFYLEIPMTITAGEAYIPGFEIDSTDDCFPWDSDIVGDVPGYRFTIVTSKKKIIPYFPQCRIPTLVDGDPSITWTELRARNRARKRQVIPQRFIPETVLDALIETAVGDSSKASSTNTGNTALTVDPVDPIFPIAVGANDPRLSVLGSGLTLLAVFPSLAAAVATIGAARTTLLISATAAVAANLTIPSNITLFFSQAGMIQPANGVTVTIQGAITAPPMKIFGNATAGQGTILVTGNRKTHTFPTEWWGDDFTNHGPAIQAALDCLRDSGRSGTVLVSGINQVSNDFQDPGGANCQIRLPERVNAMLSIRLAGSTPAQTIAFNRDLQGAVIESTLTTGDGAVIGGKVGGGAGWPIAGTHWGSVTIEHLTVRTQANPTYSGVALTYMPNVAVRNCQISTNEDVIAAIGSPPSIGITEPTTSTSYGLKLAPNNIPDQSIVDNVEIYGFYNGILSGELVSGDNVLVVFCKVGVEFPAALHRQDFNRLYVSDCAKRLIFTGGASNVQIQSLAMEHNSATPAWAQVTVDIDDPNNFGHGKVCWHLSSNGTVINDLTQNGAFYLWTESLANLPDNHSSSPSVQVTRSANQSIPHNVFTNVSFNTNVSSDPFNMHSTVTNPDRFVPAKEGDVTIDFAARFTSNATGLRQVLIWKHSAAAGGLEILLKRGNITAVNGGDTTINLTANSRATLPGDYFYIQVWENRTDGSGTESLDLVSSSAINPLQFDSPTVFFKISR